jgi:hypothetical protein
MYSGKIAVPPSGGGLKKIATNASNDLTFDSVEPLVDSTTPRT